MYQPLHAGAIQTSSPSSCFAPPSAAVGVVFILFVLGGTRVVLCLRWLLGVRYGALGQCLSACGSDNSEWKE